MATSTTPRPSHVTTAPASLTSRSLPRWSTAALLAGCVAASAAVSYLLLDRGPVVAAVLTFLSFALLLYGASRTVEGSRRAFDRLVTVLVTSAFVLALLPLVSVLWTVFDNGVARLDAEFFSSDMRNVLGAGGGAQHAILGTLLVTLAATVISVPIGVMSAIYLVEYGRGRLARALTFLVDVMTGIPSIVAGLFAYALFVIFFGPGVRLGIGGAVALSVLMIPIVVRSTEEMLKLVPNELREASYALGVPKWLTIVKVVIPTAAAGIATGVTISIARIIGETAPLLIIAGNTNNLNWDLFDGRMMTLPVYTYFSFTQPGIPPQEGIDRAWTAALVLMLIVMALNLVARLLSRLLSPKTR